MALIQFSSLGEHVVKVLKSNGIVNIIQNNLLEVNEFIIHASLELFVNIASFDNEIQMKLNKVYNIFNKFLDENF